MKTLLLALPLLLLTVVQADPADSKDKPPAEKEPPVVVLPPLEVKAASQLSFGFSIRVVRNQTTMRVLSMHVDRVASGTDADRKGLKSQSEIIAINGKPVADYEATFVPGSELARIFIGRTEGARVVMQVVPFGKQKPQTLTIVRKTLFHEINRIGGLPSD